ncbi:hypothetical protein ACIQVR_40880 [Streptomyces xanthochromogenes]|uniref:hypothetical protein n=1 Tax=Streptomyces xanthochromogenes TaxID=67384 RepID=UPI0038033B0D
MASTQLPNWAWDLVIALIAHEDEHAQGAPCFGSALAAVPAEVRAQAEAIRDYVRQSPCGVIGEESDETWAQLQARLVGLLRQP